MSDHRIQQGEIVKCDECLRARPIETAVVELFGKRVAFGPAGETDMYIEGDDGVQCYWCTEEDYQ